MICLKTQAYFLTLVMICLKIQAHFLTLVMTCLKTQAHFLTLVMTCLKIQAYFLTLVMTCLKTQGSLHPTIIPDFLQYLIAPRFGSCFLIALIACGRGGEDGYELICEGDNTTLRECEHCIAFYGMDYD